ncbi:MAG: nucleotidyltransferase family protein [Thermodesulfobacteriota bacterium]|nr:nucleotidyltransferase family protein [Thermodesulfobacteriota bacterium]
MSYWTTDVENITISKDATFHCALEHMEREKTGIALVSDNDRNLLGIITNADIRRAVLNGVSLNDKVTRLMIDKPITATDDLSRGEYYRIMVTRSINQLPIVTKSGRIVGVIYESSLRKERILLCPVVIMAGGQGSRLRPLTKDVPKPMLRIKGKPMLERIIERFRDLGVVKFYISVNYKAHVIEDYFGNGDAWRVQIDYLREKKQLGTAGSLSLLPRNMPFSFFVINADVMTDLDFCTIYRLHANNNSDITVAVKEVSYQVPYGTIEVEHGRIVSLFERPHIKKYVNAGIYVLSPATLNEIPENEFFDMTDLINKMISSGRMVNSYLIDGFWIDVGQKKDYHRANTILGEQDEAEMIKKHDEILEREMWQANVEAI